jgi:hypothetical protein
VHLYYYYNVYPILYLEPGHVATADINDSKKLLLNNCAALNGIVNNNADTIDIAVNTAS